MSMAIDDSHVIHATPAEVVTALAALSDADLVRLKQIAQLRSAGLSAVSWEDLVNETVVRSLAGARRWPRSVPFIAFLAQTIRSIANEEWRRLAHEQTSLEADLASEEGDAELLPNLAVDDISPEREVVARRTLDDIELLFHEDREAKAILHGLAHGATPEEIQVSTPLTSTQYGSAQRRIRRGLARHFGAKEN
jgi:DNA-directed RNA polymerase specialized sigma24 family protein